MNAYNQFPFPSGHPDEEGVVADAHTLYLYAKRMAPSKPIYVWGHSMGTGVAVRLVAELSVANQTPDALVLESPFNTLRDVVRGHPFSWPWRHLPHFDEMVVESLVKSGLVMDSEERIVRYVALEAFQFKISSSSTPFQNQMPHLDPPLGRRPHNSHRAG